MSMTIKELLQSTATVNATSTTSYKKGGKKKFSQSSPFGAKNTFKSKQFGTIYSYNKVVKAKPEHGIIEISMMIKGVTDKIKGKPVAAHRVMIAISGVKSEIVSADELIERVKQAVPAYADEERYTKEDILLSAINPDRKPLHGKTILEQKDGTFAIIADNIPDDCEIRVSCSCSSYYWSFMWYNIENDVQISHGRNSFMSRYKHKTQKGKEMFDAGTPMRNQQRAPGMCKHILLLLAMLTDKKTVAPMGGEGGTRSLQTQYRANINKFKKEDRLSTAQYRRLVSNFNSDRRKQSATREENSGGGRIKFSSIAAMMRGNGDIND